MQEDRADSWKERIRWIVDTHESGDTESERLGKAAKKLGVSREAVRLIYKGKSIPGGDTLASIVRAYPRVNPAWLVTGVGSRTRAHAGSVDPYSEGVAEAVRRVREQLECIESELGDRPTPKDGPPTEQERAKAKAGLRAKRRAREAREGPGPKQVDSDG